MEVQNSLVQETKKEESSRLESVFYLLIIMVFLIFLLEFGKSVPSGLIIFVVAGFGIYLLVSLETAKWKNKMRTLALAAVGPLSLVPIEFLIPRTVGELWGTDVAPLWGTMAQFFALIFAACASLWQLGEQSERIENPRHVWVRFMIIPSSSVLAAFVAFKVWNFFFSSCLLQIIGMFVKNPPIDPYGVKTALWAFDLIFTVGAVGIAAVFIGLAAVFLAGAMTVCLFAIAVDDIRTRIYRQRIDAVDMQYRRTLVRCAACGRLVDESESRTCSFCNKVFCNAHFNDSTHSCRKSRAPWEI